MYYRHFLALPGVSTGSQRPLDLHRARWQTSQNACIFYDHARVELLDAGIAVLTGNEKFEVRAEHLSLSKGSFAKIVCEHSPELEYISSEAHRALSLDELKLLLSTRDDTHRQCEKTLRCGVDDDGETLSAKSSCAMSGIGGSHANFEAAKPGFVVASESFDPQWFTHAPTAVINGKRHSPFYEGNEKGSFDGRMFVKYLEYVVSIKKKEERAVVFGDGVQTHLMHETVTFVLESNIRFVPRPPNTSGKIQNEDLWTFWIFRNHKTLGYSKVKQMHLFKILNREGRTSLGFQDAMAVAKPGWEHAMNMYSNMKAWKMGGLRPFNRLPEMLFRWDEMRVEEGRRQREEKAAATAAKKSGSGKAKKGGDKQHPNWEALLAKAPVQLGLGSRKRAGKSGDDDGDDKSGENSNDEVGDEELASGGGRIGAAASFNCAPHKKLSLSYFLQEAKAIKSMKADELKKYIKEIKKKDPSWEPEYETQAQAQLAIIEYNGEKLYGFKVEDSMLTKPLLAVRNKVREAAKRQNNRPSPEKAPVPAPAPKGAFWRFEELKRMEALQAASLPAAVATSTDTAWLLPRDSRA